MKFACRPINCRVIAILMAVLICVPSAEKSFAEEEKNPRALSAVPQKITMNFQGMDILEILKILAEQSGFNLVAGKNVSGRATLFLKDVDPWDALEVVVAANELAYEKRGDILTVMSQRDYELIHGQPYLDRRVLKSFVPRYAKAADVSRALAQMKSNVGRVIADEATNTLIVMDTPDLVDQMLKISQQMDQPVETRLISLNNAPAKGLLSSVQEALTKGVGRLSADERSNQLAVTDYPSRLNEIVRMIRAFDERSSEVLIDAKIIQVTLSDKLQLGIDWQTFISKQLQFKGATALNLATGAIATFNALDGAQTGSAKLVVEALRTFGNTRILSEPRLMVVNNQEAKILVGSKEPYVTTQISQTGTGTSVTSETVNFIDVGVKLFVTPTITRDGFVLMKVRPEVSSRTGTLTTGQKNEVPIVETAEAETILLVQDGGTVILGGLIKDEESVDEQRIPLLGDIPVLGIPFRSQKKTVKRTELIVLLTPRIVTGQRGETFFATPEAQDKAQAAEVFTAGPETEELYMRTLEEGVQRVTRVQSLLGAKKGTVQMKVTLFPDGRIQGFPEVLSSDDPSLTDLAKTAVLVASPFPAFPSDFEQTPKTFTVPVRYE